MLDPVNLYLPDFQNWQSEDGKETQVIRIQDLMTHTSGLPPYADVQKLSKEHGILNPKALMEHLPARFPSADRLPVQLPELHHPAAHRGNRQRAITPRFRTAA